MEIKTWGNALDYTLDTRQTWRTGNGRKTALINAGHFTKAVGLSFPVRKVDQCLINRVSREFEDEGKSDATINRIVSAVSTVLNHCAFDGLIPTPPRFRRRKEIEGRITYYTKDEVDQLYHASLDPFQRDDLADIVLVAAYTGMRQGELLKLRARDVDLGLNTIFVGGLQLLDEVFSHCSTYLLQYVQINDLPHTTVYLRQALSPKHYLLLLITHQLNQGQQLLQ